MIVDLVIENYLADLVTAAQAVLGDDLVGAYASGSVGMGAYQPGRSDVDIALVVENELDRPTKEALVGALRHESLPCPARGLELVVYRRSIAASGTPAPGFEVELNSGPAMDFRATFDPAERPVGDGLFWYGLDRSIVHQSALRLLGPPAGEVFADLSRSDLRGLLVDALTWWIALPTPADDAPAPGADDAVLGACRSLVKFRDDVWLAKVAAGERLLRTDGPDGLIERALRARRGGQPPGGGEARRFQHRVLEVIRGN